MMSLANGLAPEPRIGQTFKSRFSMRPVMQAAEQQYRARHSIFAGGISSARAGDH
jgi:hypothetical protein